MGFSLKKLFHATGASAVYGAFANPLGALGGGGGNGQAGKVDALSAAARTAAAQNYAAGQVEQRRAIGETRGAFKNARNAVAVGRTNASQGVVDQGKVLGARATQGLVDGGRFNTTVAENAQQGITAGMTRAQADIEAHYAQVMGELDIGEQQTINGIRQNIAGGAFQQGALQAGLYQNHAALINAQPEEDPNAWLDSLLGIVGTGVGVYAGKHL